MTNFGIFITVIYAVVILYLKWPIGSELKALKLNELGDFLAGVFGPLTLFWLILGYVQQQKELKQNTKALELQADELRKSVEQHKELVKTANEQLQTDKAVLEFERARERKNELPDIAIVSARKTMSVGMHQHFEIKIKNSGKIASSLRVISTPELTQMPVTRVRDFLDTGAVHEIRWDEEKSGKMPEELLVNILFLAPDQTEHSELYRIKVLQDSHLLDLTKIS
ncbi:hypothetical protein ACWOKL_004255 [Vibrio vulnificus]|uniref:hypothetical protein n=1 Tax=Vibrio campbellii TaxID=680 RepID=UPI0006820CF8|nr:hypothetical protein [Vibrio campbellii]EGR0072775.1 hypothetical protein [Vibrio vulnificus]EII3057042.1 hypothetical protein [Vibrio vulnificus]